MLSKLIPGRWIGVSTGWAVFLVGLGWLIFISALHYWLNIETGKRETVRMGYMPVITNLACPLLDYATREGEGLRFEALKFSSFSEMAEALRNGHIEVAFIIAPISVQLHQQGAGVKIICIGNRHESTLVYRKDLKIKDFRDLAGKSLAVPLRFSGHNLCVRQLAEQYGVSDKDLDIREINPPDMAAALAAGSLDAYFVGEPFAARTAKPGDGKVLYYVEQVWPNFICNLVLTRQDFIDRRPDRVALLVQGAARSGIWAKQHPSEAAKIAAEYWNQPADLVEYALNTPSGRIVYDRFVPKHDEIQQIANLMVRFKLIEKSNVDGLVDDRFAKQANIEGVADFNSILDHPLGK
jgi:NitT/TauT family transport system substrate-binding protein